VPAETDRLLYAADQAGTLFLGIEGAMAAIDGNQDLLGLLVLACATAFGGDIPLASRVSGGIGICCTLQIGERASVSTKATGERPRLLCLRRCTQCRRDHRK
jgi:hypothetical protein